jgi:DNA-binding GntR family transcriptional regulator
MKMTHRNPDQLTVRAYVRDSIRASIFAGELTPGDRLAQAVIARELQVSTTPVREALRELATEGLLQLDAHRGAVVRGLDADELRDVHELRTLLEPHVMRKAVPRLTEQQLQQAEQIHDEMVAADSISSWAELNRRFHRIFLDASGSERLARIVRGLQDSYAAYVVSTLNRDPDRRRRADAEHRELLDAARRGDAELATRVLLEHIGVPLEIAEQLEQTGDGTSPGVGTASVETG